MLILDTLYLLAK